MRKINTHLKAFFQKNVWLVIILSTSISFITSFHAFGQCGTTVNSVANQVYCNTASTMANNFTGGSSGTQYSWVNSNPAIGLAANGNGSISPFTAINTTNAPITATITVTPSNIGGFAYIPNSGSDNVSVINTATNTVVATITVGTFPFAVSVSPDGSRVYVANTNSNNVSVINTASNAVVATIAVQNSPRGITVSPDGGRVYVTNNFSDNVSVINAATNTVIATLLSVSRPFGVAVSPDGSRLYVTNFGYNDITVFNTTSTAITVVNVGTSPYGVAVSPNGSRVYVANRVTNNVSVINTATNTVVATVTVGTTPTGIAVSPDGSRVYVTNSASNTVSVINTANNTITASYFTGINPVGVSVSLDGSRLYVANSSSNTVSIYNTITNTLFNTVAMGINPTAFGNFVHEQTCTGTPTTFTITVNPTPTVNAVANQVLCNAANTSAISFGGAVSGTVYSWVNNNTSIGLAASGSGNIGSFVATNNGTTPVTASITVTPSYTNAGVTCTGNPTTFTITVNPTPTVNTVASQSLCNTANTTAIGFGGAVSGTVYNWVNNNSSIGLAATGSGNIGSFAATNTGTSPVTATITVTPSYTNPAGGGACTGSPKTFTITVNPTTTVNAVANQVLCNGANTMAISFTGAVSGTVYSWVNNNSSIGLAATGSGNIGSFAATNTGTSPVTATITVTPSYTNPAGGGACTGSPITFTITVNPTPTVNTVANQVLCNGANTTAIGFSGAVSGTVYSWVNNNTSIGLAASGSGNIASFMATNTGTSPVTATITVTPSYTNPAGGGACTGSPITFTITVNPTPTVNTVANQVLCNGANTTAIGFSGAVSGTVYNWVNNTPGIGLATNGMGNIPSFATTNTTNAPITATITTTPITNTTGGFAYISNYGSDNVSVINLVSNTVVATVAVGDGPYGIAVSPDGTKVYVANIGSDNISVISTASNTVVATVAVGDGPYGLSVSPNGSRVYVSNQFSDNVSVINTATNTTIATVVVETNPVGVAISPDGSRVYIANTNSSNVSVISTASNAVVATIAVGNVPNGIAVSPDGSRVYVANFVSGNVSFINTTSNMVVANVSVGASPTGIALSPDGSKLYVSNFNSDDVSVINTASTSVVATVAVGDGPVGISLSPDGSQLYVANFNANNVSVINTASNTAAATVAVGTNPAAFGNFVNSGAANACTGTPTTFTITVNPTPTVNTVANQVVCYNTATTAVTFSGNVPGTVYNWLNNVPGIGLPSSGTGDIPSFISSFATNAPVVATITVIPSYTNAGVTCQSDVTQFTITVNPTPTVNTVANQVLCNNASTSAISFSGAVSGTVYSWVNNTPSIGLAASGTGNIGSFVATNTGLTPVTASVTVTPTYTNAGRTCTGTPTTFTITVNPTPTVNTVANQVLCNAANTTAISFGGAVSGTVYSWVNNNTSIGLAASGSGNIGGFVATNTGSTPVTASVTVTPTYTNAGRTCTGTPTTFTITVNPTPTVNTVVNQVLCNSVNTAAISFSGAVSGTVYSWVNNTSSIGLAASGTGNIASFVATNNGTTPVTATITVTPSYTNAGSTCTGSTKIFTITVNPTPTVNTVANQVLCNAANTTAISFSGAVSGTVYSWVNNTPIIGLAASGSGNIGSFVATNNGTTPVTATITVTPSYTNEGSTCTGSPTTFTITVNPRPTITCPVNIMVTNTTGQCGANVSYPAATFTGVPTPTVTYPIPSGSFFAIGTTTVMATATNACGTASCSFTVTVKDVQKPVIICPANITANTNLPGVCAPIVSYEIKAFDNCSGVTITRTAGPASGSGFPTGVTTVTHVATDANGNSTSCSFTVTVPSVILPVLQYFPVDSTVCVGGSTALKVIVPIATAYQWQYLFAGVLWTNITSATAATLTLNNIPAINNGLLYRCQVTMPASSPLSVCNLLTNYTNPIRLNVVSCGTMPIARAATPEAVITKLPAQVQVYPNPASNMVTILIPDAATYKKVEVYDAAGKMVLGKTVINGSNTINLSQLADGQYIIKLMGSDGKVEVKKLVVEK